MSRELFAKKQNKVVPFEQSGQFFHRKAQKYMDSNNYINALSFYRKAVEKEPQNIEYSLDLAEIFTEMGYFDQSSRILFSIIQKDGTRTECYFGLGCNFLGLQDFDKAMKSFERYLEAEPYGIYSRDARDLLDIIEDQEYFEDDVNIFDPAKEELYDLAIEGKDLLDKGEYDEAIKCLEKVVDQEPDLVFVKNNLALAYFCIGKLEKAISISMDVLKEDPKNVHANCNLCLFYNEMDGAQDSEGFLQTILDFKSQEPEEIHKIAVTLCELNKHEEANRALKVLIQYKPYDLRVLHYMAVSFFNMGRYKDALKYWSKISKIEPENSISSFYIRLAQEYIREGGSEEISYHFQVPYYEIVGRIKNLNNILKLREQDLLVKWEKDDSFRTLLAWGLELNDELIKKAILNVVASFEDNKAEDFLRDFLLRINESEELKTEALGLLKQMHASEPYIAYVEDDLVEVKVEIGEDMHFEMPLGMRKVLDIAFHQMRGRYEKGYTQEIEQIWTEFVKKLYPNYLPRIKKHEAWAAALEIYYCIEQDIPITKVEVSNRYGITYSAMNNNYNRIKRVLEN